MDAMNIGMVSPYSWDFPGGVNRHVEQLSGALRRRGHEVTVMAPGSRDAGFFRTAGDSFAVKANRSIAHLAFGPRVAARVRGFLEEGGFDVLHLHEPLIPSVSLIALWLSRTANMATFHAAREGGSIGYRLARPVLGSLAGRIHLRAAVSPAALELISRYFPASYRIIPNGVDTRIFKSEGPTIPGLDERAFYLLFVGRAEPRKGLEVLLEALPAVRGEYPETRLLAVGVGEDLGEREGVEWMGRLRDEKVPCAYRSAGIMVSPALGWESFGIVLVEAMASGLPVVASDIPGYRSVVQNGVQGILVPPGDAAALADAIRKLLSDEALRGRMAEAALERANEFSWDRLVVEVERAYEEAVINHGRAA